MSVEHNLVHMLHQQARFLNKEINERLRDHGLYNSQWSILFCLNTYGPMTQTEIWQYLNVEAPTVTRTLKRMEEKGWVVRKQGDDKRERLIQLTETAKLKFEEIKQTVKNFEQEMLENLTLNEQDQFLSLLIKLGSKGRNDDG